MEKTAEQKKPVNAEQIARMAVQGKDISHFFTGGRMMHPIQRVNVDFTGEMLEELDQEAAGLNISRQAVIKRPVREGLDRRFSGRVSSRQAPSRTWISPRPRRASGK